MPYIIEILFDTPAETNIQAIWQHLTQAGLPSSLDAEGYRPHLTLVVFDTPKSEFDMERCHLRMKRLASQTAPFPMTITHFGLFPTSTEFENVVFLGIAPTQALLGFHRATSTLCQQEIREVRPLYLPDAWTPHITLGFNLTPAQAQGILGLAWEIPLPFTAHAQAVQLVEVTQERSQEHFLCSLRGAG